MPSRAVDWAERHPWRLLGAYLLVTTALYQLALRAPLYAPMVVPPLPWEDAVPLLPWSAWIYMTYFALMPSFVVATREAADPRLGARLLLAAMLVVLGNLTINLFLPTEVGRVLDPAAAGGWPLSQIIEGDTPRAALPSGHVSLPTALTALAFVGGLRARWAYAAWTILLGVSVLTTRQHVLLDALAGLVYGGVGAGLAYLAVRRR
ncbi:MAG: phosphatase PAP2 family protein [Sandaracinaceae bacterium]|nr:phosphatase PAP2 family protein [Sandaracinaceae bacterium]